MNVVLGWGWVLYGDDLGLLRCDRPSAPAAATNTLPTSAAGDSTGHTHCTTNLCHTTQLSRSALSLFLFCCQQVASSATSSLSGTGLLFLRCQNPTIHSHRVASHPAPKGWTPPKSTNLGISHFRFFLFHRFFPLWSILQHLQCQKRPKAPTFSSGAYH